MSDVYSSNSGNPYVHADESGDQPYYVSGDVMPWEKLSDLTRRSPRCSENDSKEAASDLAQFAEMMRAVPSGNQYAKIEDNACEPSHESFGNPYRYINNDDDIQQPYYSVGDKLPWEIAQADVRSNPTEGDWARFFVTRPLGRGQKQRTDAQIEELARTLQLKLWKQRRQLFGETDDPIKVLDPAKVLELAGYDVQYYAGGLGRSTRKGTGVEVGGLLDPINKVVGVSTLMSRSAILFTLAHELGHVVLGSAGTVVHRDTALNGTRNIRDPIEREAEKFAAFFLMPGKYLRKAFLRRFLTERFELDDTSAFALRAASRDDVLKEFQTLRALSTYLASAESYNGSSFSSLTFAFNVSPKAMAIRLEELGLVN